MKLIYLPLLILTGCCTTDTKIGIPPRPELIPVSPEVWATVGPEAQDTWTLNDLALKEHVKRLEARIRIHDEAH